MALTGKIMSLFEDKDMNSPIFPRTKTKAVSDDNGIGLDTILDTVVYTEEYSGDVAMVPLNADTFGGYSVDAFVNKIYPVGSIYMSINPTSPATLFGGTWEQIKDVFLLSAGGTYTAGSTGGEATHTLTVNEMPSHTHTQNAHSHSFSTFTKDGSGSSASGAAKTATTGTTGSTTATNQNTGGSKPHNNMPPYLAVYMWKRTA